MVTSAHVPSRSVALPGPVLQPIQVDTAMMAPIAAVARAFFPRGMGDLDGVVGAKISGARGRSRQFSQLARIAPFGRAQARDPARPAGSRRTPRTVLGRRRMHLTSRLWANSAPAAAPGPLDGDIPATPLARSGSV